MSIVETTHEDDGKRKGKMIMPEPPCGCISRGLEAASYLGSAAQTMKGHARPQKNVKDVLAET